LQGKNRAAAASPRFHQKGRITVKKLLALTVVAGILGLTTGCPSDSTKKTTTGTPTSKPADKPKEDKPAADKPKEGGTAPKPEAKPEAKPDNKDKPKP
jgi:hypothetical protein